MSVGMIIWHRNMKKKQLRYMDADNFIVHIKIDVIQADIVKDVETRSETSNYELERPLSKMKSNCFNKR